MKQRPAFILSLDCEGLWGFPDILTDQLRSQFTNRRLSNCYSRLINLLEEYRLKATFAFVGAFTLFEDDLQHCHDWFENLPERGKRWVQPFLDDAARGSFDGWLNPGAFETVKSAGVHEIACHGFTHQVLSPDSIPLDEFFYEMQGVRWWLQAKELQTLSTFIDPRNAVGYAPQLSEFGFKGYRDGVDYSVPGSLDRLRGLARELNVWGRSQPRPALHDPIVIPSGFFLNWRSGAREWVPVGVTVARWESMLKHAMRKGGVVHLWSHPHNFVTGSYQFELLESILEMVRKYVSAGDIVNLTQHEYCSQVGEG